MGLHGLVRHLTNVERSWLRDVFAGEEGLVFDWTEQDPDAEWRVPRVRLWLISWATTLPSPTGATRW